MLKKYVLCLFFALFSFTSLAVGYDQVVVMKFDTSLKTSTGYSVSGSGITVKDKMFGISPRKSGGIDSGATLDDIFAFDYKRQQDFNGTTGYTKTSSELEQGVIIPVQKNGTSTAKKGLFQLVETSNASGEPVDTYLIEQNFTLPASYMTLTEQSVSSGKRFTYSDTVNKSENFSAFKTQEYVVRIIKGTNTSLYNYDVVGKNNPIKNSLADVNYFIYGSGNYLDFVVGADEYTKEQTAKNGDISVKFMPGTFDIYGLEQGNYQIEVYSKRYTESTSNRGALVITKEANKSFVVGAKPTTGIEILSFDTSKWTSIEAYIKTTSFTQLTTIGVTETYNSSNSNANSLVFVQEGASVTVTSGAIEQKWKVNYITPFTTSDDKVRTVSFVGKIDTTNDSTDNGSNSTIGTSYQVYLQPSLVQGYPHQTVFGYFKNNITLNGTYEIADIDMNKYTGGYKKVVTSSPSSIDSLWAGNYTDISNLANTSFNWGPINNSVKGISIRKVVSDSNGKLQNTSGTPADFSFYTTKGASNFKETAYTGAATDTTSFTWDSPEKSSFNTTISQDKILFRIVRVGSGATTESGVYSYNGGTSTAELPKYYFNPIEHTNPLKSSDAELKSFTSGASNYADLVFTSGLNATKTTSEASFAYNPNNALSISGLPRDNYLIQIYTLQNADTTTQQGGVYDYKVLTYGGYSNFVMGLPKIYGSDELKNQNDIFTINGISYKDTTVTSGQSVVTKRNVTVELVTKSRQNLNLKASNIINGLTVTSGSAYNHVLENKYGGVTPGALDADITPVTVTPSTRSNFNYPLDIVLVIDNSGSMGDEITSVKNNLGSFSAGLKAKGYDVKYNLITFGPNQNSGIGAAWRNSVFKEDNNYLATFKYTTADPWFDGATSAGVASLTSALNSLNATSGYYGDQENGAWGLDRAINHLNTYGRYLATNNTIVSNSVGKANSANLPSKKWIIFMTDENMDSQYINTLGYTAGNVVSSLATKMSTGGIALTGMYNLNVNTGSNANATTYVNAITTNSSITGATATRNNSQVKINDKLGHLGLWPVDQGDIYYSDFAKIKGFDFHPYELGSNGGNIPDNLTDALSNIGVVEYWDLTYESPYTENDGEDREVKFAIGKIPEIGFNGQPTGKMLPITPATTQKQRIYNVPESKIDALFENPDPVTYQLIKENGKIVLTARAQSEYTDSKTKKKVNKPIIKGTFIVTDDKGHVYSRTSTDSSSEKVILTGTTTDKNGVDLNSQWYRATSTVDWNTFQTIFGDKPLLTVKFIAETEGEAKEITLANVQVVDGDVPHITNISLINNTLKDFMSTLKNNGSNLFSSTEVSSASTVTTSVAMDGTGSIFDFTTSGLNVKNGDNIDVLFTVKDESVVPSTAGGFTVVNVTSKGAIYSTGGAFQVTYGSTVYDLYSTSSDLKITNVSHSPSTGVSVWKASGIKYDETVGNNFSVKIIDGSIIKDSVTGKVGNETSGDVKNAFKVPNLVDNTKFQQRLTSEGGIVGFENYYNSSLKVENPNAEALGYLVVFDKDYSKRDTTGSGLVTGIGYQEVSSKDIMSAKSSSNVTMSFNDGYYKYAQVYAFNKAGAVKNITTGTTEWTLSNVVTSINNVAKDKEFYVDHVAPRISNEVFYKSADANTELNSIDLAKNLLLGANKPYKVGDTVGISATAIDYNFYGSKESSSGSAIDVTDNSGALQVYTGVATNNPIAYVKTGLAKDQNPPLGILDYEILVNFYDKAGNLTVKTIKVIYDDRIPAKVVTSYGAIGTTSDSTPLSNMKYTNNVGLPLISSGSLTPLVLGAIMNGADIDYIGDITGIDTTSSVNLTTFGKKSNVSLKYIPSLNALNTLTLTTYSHSGQKFKDGTQTTYTDFIVLDTKINYGTTTITKTLKENYKLSEFIASITELVGLKEFEIRKLSGPNSTLAYTAGATGTFAIGSSYGTPVLINEAKYYSVPNVSAIKSGDSYSIQFISQGTYVYDLKLIDRLGNETVYRLTLTVSNNPIDIIGKTNNSSIELKSKANQDNGKIKIESRTER